MQNIQLNFHTDYSSIISVQPAMIGDYFSPSLWHYSALFLLISFIILKVISLVLNKSIREGTTTLMVLSSIFSKAKDMIMKDNLPIWYKTMELKNDDNFLDKVVKENEKSGNYDISVSHDEETGSIKIFFFPRKTFSPLTEKFTDSIKQSCYNKIKSLKHIIPAKHREEIVGDLVEVYYDLRQEGHSTFWITLIMSCKIFLVFTASLKIRITDLSSPTEKKGIGTQ